MYSVYALSISTLKISLLLQAFLESRQRTQLQVSML
jgi:hypothetical protein